jgi:phosphinothricin acetyltransferase
VRIRLATARDGDAVAAIYRPIVAGTAISFETTLPDREEMARRIDETLRSYPWLVCDVDGRTTGYAYSSRLACTAASATSWIVGTTSGGGS